MKLDRIHENDTATTPLLSAVASVVPVKLPFNLET